MKIISSDVFIGKYEKKWSWEFCISAFVIVDNPDTCSGLLMWENARIWTKSLGFH